MLNLGTDTVWTGTDQAVVAPLGAVSFPASVNLTTLGPVPQLTLPPNSTGADAPATGVSGHASYAASQNPGKSESPVWPTIVMLLGSMLLLHLIFWRDGNIGD
jgi:hypothetical protein